MNHKTLQTAVCHRCLEQPAMQTCRVCSDRVYCSDSCAMSSWTSDHYSQCSHGTGTPLPVRPLRLVLLLPYTKTPDRATFVRVSNADATMIKTRSCRRIDDVFTCKDLNFSPSPMGSFWMIDQCWDIPLDSKFDVYTIDGNCFRRRFFKKIGSEAGVVFGAIFECSVGTRLNCNQSATRSVTSNLQIDLRHMSVVRPMHQRRRSSRAPNQRELASTSYWFSPYNRLGDGRLTMAQLLHTDEFKRSYIPDDAHQEKRDVVDTIARQDNYCPSVEQLADEEVRCSIMGRFIGDARHHSSLFLLLARKNPRVALFQHGDNIQGCAICGDCEARCIRYLPCRHAAACPPCSDVWLARSNRTCHVCRTRVRRLELVPRLELEHENKCPEQQECVRLCSSTKADQ